MPFFVLTLAVVEVLATPSYVWVTSEYVEHAPPEGPTRTMPLFLQYRSA